MIMSLLFWSASTLAQNNSGFESGLDYWQWTGKISVEVNSGAYKGNNCVRLEGSSAKIFQKAIVSPLSIIQLSAYTRTIGDSTMAYSFLEFYDNRDRLIIEYKSNLNASGNYSKTGYYTLAPARSEYLKFGISKTAVQGIVFGDDIELGIEPVKYYNSGQTGFDIKQYMKPFWETDTVFNETVLLSSVENREATGNLLFTPSEIIDIRNYDLKMTYSEGADYTIRGNTITKTIGSSIPSVADSSFSEKDLAWYDLQSKWISVTYLHKDKWTGSKPVYKGDEMPSVIMKLKSSSPLIIVACGMSITRGMDVSGYAGISPFMPPYADLFVHQLRKEYHYDDITLYNAGLPGAYSDWAAQYTDQYINAFEPDLVILDFGMNDFWKYSPEQFKSQILKIIEKCRGHNRNVEFLLISNMNFDPDYIKPGNTYKTFYETNLTGYNTVLQSLCNKGIINLDMTTISNEIYNIKKAKDCLANPLHPNDYLARWYAQGMAALFIKPTIQIP
jgi:lysophospholipase L1-like esterase